MNVNRYTLIKNSMLVLLICGSVAFWFTRSSSSRCESFIDLTSALEKEHVVDALIIGSGPAGLSAAVYTKRAGLNTWILEGNEPGGLLTKTTMVENWPGEEAILGNDIIGKLRNQVSNLGAEFLSDAVVEVDFSQYPYKITTEDGHVFYALTVILATGATPKKLGIPGENRFWGMGVTTCAVCDAPFYKGQDVIVVGGGDSAVEEAMQLSSYARTITIMVRRDVMRAAQRMQDRLKGFSNISVRYNVEVKKIHGNDQGVNQITVLNNKTGETTREDISGVFLAIGHIPNTDIVKGQIDLLPSGHIELKTRRQTTSVPGVFAAGDVADPIYRQAGTSAGYGIGAGLDAEHFLREHGYDEDLRNKLKKKRFIPGCNALTEFEAQCITSEEQFDDIAKNKRGIVLVDFYGQFCPSCMAMIPAVNQIAAEYKDQATVVKIDIDQVPAIAERLKVTTVPSLVVLQDGIEIARYADPLSKSELRNILKSALEGQ